MHTIGAGGASHTVALHQHNTPTWDKDAILSSASIGGQAPGKPLLKVFLFLYIPLCSSLTLLVGQRPPFVVSLSQCSGRLLLHKTTKCLFTQLVLEIITTVQLALIPRYQNVTLFSLDWLATTGSMSAAYRKRTWQESDAVVYSGGLMVECRVYESFLPSTCAHRVKIQDCARH